MSLITKVAQPFTLLCASCYQQKLGKRAVTRMRRSCHPGDSGTTCSFPFSIMLHGKYMDNFINWEEPKIAFFWLWLINTIEDSNAIISKAVRVITVNYAPFYCLNDKLLSSIIYSKSTFCTIMTPFPDPVTYVYPVT